MPQQRRCAMASSCGRREQHRGRRVSPTTAVHCEAGCGAIFCSSGCRAKHACTANRPAAVGLTGLLVQALLVLNAVQQQVQQVQQVPVQVQQQQQQQLHQHQQQQQLHQHQQQQHGQQQHQHQHGQQQHQQQGQQHPRLPVTTPPADMHAAHALEAEHARTREQRGQLEPSEELLQRIRALPRDTSSGLLVLELFCGCGRHSAALEAVLRNNLIYARGTRVNVARLTVDNDPNLAPGLLADLGVWQPVHTQCLMEMYPNKHFIVHASPPCQAYSVANTTSAAPLEARLSAADRLVQAALDIYHGLGSRALVLMLENPGTGKLVGRPVIAELGEPTLVDYCQYGGITRKRTGLWASFSLVQHGFKARLCIPGSCLACFEGGGKLKHSIRWEQTSTRGAGAFARQSLPPQLSQQVGHALCKYLMEHWQPAHVTATRVRASRGPGEGQ